MEKYIFYEHYREKEWNSLHPNVSRRTIKSAMFRGMIPHMKTWVSISISIWSRNQNLRRKISLSCITWPKDQLFTTRTLVLFLRTFAAVNPKRLGISWLVERLWTFEERCCMSQLCRHWPCSFVPERKLYRKFTSFLPSRPNMSD